MRYLLDTMSFSAFMEVDARLDKHRARLKDEDEVYISVVTTGEVIVVDPPLTELGRQQAQSTAESLKDKTIAVLYYNPYRRALATATITVGSAQRCSTRCLTYLPATVAVLSRTTAASPR